MSAFAEQDRKKVVWGTLVTVGGGLAYALYQASDFVLEGLFGLRAFGTYVVVLSLVEFLGHLLLAGFLDAVTVFVSRTIHAKDSPLGLRPESPELDRILATSVLVPFAAALFLAIGINLSADFIYEQFWSQHDGSIKELLEVSVWALPAMVLMHVPVEALKAHLNVHASVFVTQVLFPYGLLGLAMVLHLGAGMGIEAMAYALVASAVFCVPISLYLCSRAIRLGRIVRALFAQGPDRELLAFAVPQSLNMAFNLGMVRIDALVLSAMPGISAESIGLYGLAVRATQLIRLLKLAFSGMFGPLAAKYHAAGNREGLREALFRFTQISCTLTIPAWLIVMALFPDYASTHAPEMAKQGLSFVWVLTLGPLVGGFIGFAGNLLLMTGHARILLLNSSIAAVLNLVLNLWMIPRWGLLGAATATAIANTLMSIAQMEEMRRMEGYQFRWSIYQQVCVASVLPLLMVIGMHHLPLGRLLPPGLTALSAHLLLGGLAVGLYALTLIFLPGESAILEPLKEQWTKRRRPSP